MQRGIVRASRSIPAQVINMYWVTEYTDRIRALMIDSSDSSLTYAALEARLAIERVCYERLKVAHDYISTRDLRTWKPQYVVQTLMETVDPKIASEWRLEMRSAAGEYDEIGTQKGFDSKKLSQLWQAMSSFLHGTIPKARNESIAHYAPANKIRSRLEEVLQELDRIGQGTMVAASVFEVVSFECNCGRSNKRSIHGLSDGAVINCIGEGCKEQYIVHKTGDDFSFQSRFLGLFCHSCTRETKFPFRALAELPKDALGSFDCRECGSKNDFMWKLMQVTRDPSRGPPATNQPVG